MKHFLEELCIAALAWIPTAAGMGARLLLWRPLFKRCGGQVRAQASPCRAAKT